MSENLKIWSKLEATDPKYTKSFKKGGGFSGTSINPTYVIKKLTETFGPCGIGWGDKIIESRFDGGTLLKDPKTALESTETIHTIILEMWYLEEIPEMEGPVKEKRTVIGVGTTTFVGSNKYGVFTDEEYFKKTMTDALTNAAKKIGMSSDIFMGLYDDQKYLAELKEKFGNFPKRSKTASSLLACETMEEYLAIKSEFELQWGPEVFDCPSGKQGDNNETWKQVFSIAWKRLNNISPIEDQEQGQTKTPKQIQEEWKAIADKCQDSDTIDMLEKDISINKCLGTDENWGVLDDLHKQFD